MANEPTINDNDFLITAAKQAMEMQAREGSDFAPTLVLQHKTGETIVVLLATGGHPYDTLYSNADALIQAPLASLSLTTDTYMWKGEPEDFQGGPLQPRFEAGDPNVTEAVQIVTVHTVAGEALTMGVTLPYEHNRILRTVTWGEPMTDATSHGGRMIDLLKAILIFSSEKV